LAGIKGLPDLAARQTRERGVTRKVTSQCPTFELENDPPRVHTDFGQPCSWLLSRGASEVSVTFRIPIC
jgi:hypothetical protein